MYDRHTYSPRDLRYDKEVFSVIRTTLIRAALSKHQESSLARKSNAADHRPCGRPHLDVWI
jgi:hypothetical protein